MILSIEAVSKRYGAAVALEAVTLTIPEGRRTAIVGPSGSGKSTLLRLLAGFEAPDSGRIVLDGRLIADGPAIVPAHRRAIGIVSQDGALFPHLSVAANIGFGLDRAASRQAGHVRDLMRLVGLDAALHDRNPHELSGGQQQRVALARALARKPLMMLLDEPFSALDTGLRDATRRAVARVLADAGVTCILVTHDQAEALSFADQLAVLHEGRLVQAGTPRDLYRHPVDPEVAAFLGDAIVLAAELSDGFARCSLGRIAVAHPAGSGSAEIMLRPEQIRIGRGTEAGACTGRVVEVAFGGPVSAMTIELLAGSRADKRAVADPDRIELKAFGLDLPGVGDVVQLAVEGTAHVFERGHGGGRRRAGTRDKGEKNG